MHQVTMPTTGHAWVGRWCGAHADLAVEPAGERAVVRVLNGRRVATFDPSQLRDDLDHGRVARSLDGDRFGFVRTARSQRIGGTCGIEPGAVAFVASPDAEVCLDPDEVDGFVVWLAHHERGAVRVSDLFLPEPTSWGLRGDPYLWATMAERLQGPMVSTPSNLDALLHQTFADATGVDLRTTSEEMFGREEFAHGGMSSGFVHVETWRGRLFPLLHRRATQRFGG